MASACSIHNSNENYSSIFTRFIIYCFATILIACRTSFCLLPSLNFFFSFDPKIFFWVPMQFPFAHLAKGMKWFNELFKGFFLDPMFVLLRMAFNMDMNCIFIAQRNTRRTTLSWSMVAQLVKFIKKSLLLHYRHLKPYSRILLHQSF